MKQTLQLLQDKAKVKQALTMTGNELKTIAQNYYQYGALLIAVALFSFITAPKPALAACVSGIDDVSGEPCLELDVNTWIGNMFNGMNIGSSTIGSPLFLIGGITAGMILVMVLIGMFLKQIKAIG